jgi:hypothetical protein
VERPVNEIRQNLNLREDFFQTDFIIFAPHTVVVAQLVRASDCGSEGRRFEPGHPPKASFMEAFFFLEVFFPVGLIPFS